MDYTVHGVAKSWTQLRDFHFSLFQAHAVFSIFGGLQYALKQHSTITGYFWSVLLQKATMLKFLTY